MPNGRQVPTAMEWKEIGTAPTTTLARPTIAAAAAAPEEVTLSPLARTLSRILGPYLVATRAAGLLRPGAGLAGKAVQALLRPEITGVRAIGRAVGRAAPVVGRAVGRAVPRIGRVLRGVARRGERLLPGQPGPGALPGPLLFMPIIPGVTPGKPTLPTRKGRRARAFQQAVTPYERAADLTALEPQEASPLETAIISMLTEGA